MKDVEDIRSNSLTLKQNASKYEVSVVTLRKELKRVSDDSGKPKPPIESWKYYHHRPSTEFNDDSRINLTHSKNNNDLDAQAMQNSFKENWQNVDKKFKKNPVAGETKFQMFHKDKNGGHVKSEKFYNEKTKKFRK